MNRPSRIIAAAPEMISSAGWPTSISVPCQRSRFFAISSALPAQAAMCRSCPHMCATGTDSPASFFVRAVLANARPVFSSIGSASSSVRSMTTGPGPFLRSATMPVPPTPVVTS